MNMIVRNLKDKVVLETTYIAHGGAIAQMILDRRVLKEIGFLAVANLAPGKEIEWRIEVARRPLAGALLLTISGGCPGKEIEAHVDPMEEIYFVMNGSGKMHVGEDSRQVGPGDATWIPAGSSHSLLNNGDENLVILVVASPNW